MARRGRQRGTDDDIAPAVTVLVFLIIGLTVISPLFRLILLVLIPLVLAAGLMIVAAAGCRRRYNRPAQTQMNAAGFVCTTASVPSITVVATPPTGYGISRLGQQRPVTIDDLRSIDWFQFEKVVAKMYEGRGNQVELRGGANPDGGIDMVLTKGENRAAVQCKHWKIWKAGIRQVREFFGAMKAEGFDRGIFVTLQDCTQDARQFAGENGISLVTAADLHEMLVQADASSLAAC